MAWVVKPLLHERFYNYAIETKTKGKREREREREGKKI